MQRKKRVEISNMKKASSFKLSLKFIFTLVLTFFFVLIHLGLEILNSLMMYELIENHEKLYQDLIAISTSTIIFEVNEIKLKN